MLRGDWEATPELRYKRRCDKRGVPTDSFIIQQKYQRTIYEHTGQELVPIKVEIKWEEPPKVD